jgi:tRNA A-37 threonylcarbamoyl transferase component Bud32
MATKKIVQILLSRPSINFTIKNNDNKLAADVADHKEVKKLFEVFLSEKNTLSSKYTQKVTIHNTKNDNIKKMFENIIDDSAYRNLNNKKKTSDSSEQNKSPSYGHNTTGETKANSSLNTSDSDISGGNTSSEEERIGPHSFIVHSLIGKGSFGEVYLVEKKNTKAIYAMKVLNKNKIMKHNLIKYALTERNVLSLTSHPFIVKLNWAFQTVEKLFLILDYCPGGDLGEHLQKERRFSEERSRIYLAEIVLALEDLHKRDIIFRDLKPDNIVLDPEGHAMLTDFGLSKEGVLDHAQGAKSFCGSVAYLAPEMLKRVGHGKAVDWYLLGVVFYEMLVGVPPYYANNREQLFYNIEKAPLKIPSYLSNESKSLLKGLLQRNPTKRLGSGKGDSEEIKSHPFFQGINWKDVENRKLKPPLVEPKVKLSAKIPLNVFDAAVNQNDKDRISGWSFVAQTQPN